MYYALLPLFVAAVALLITPAANAATIYSETFSGASTTDLNGTTPDDTTSGNTWIASPDWNKDGSADDTGSDTGNDDNAFLAFTPAAGNVYTLSATLAQPSGSSWAAIGFTQNNNLTDDFWMNNAQPWVLYRSNSNVDSFLGIGTAGSLDEGNHAGSTTLTIVLDTTQTQWSVEWFVGGSSARTETFALGSNPTGISYVGLGRERGTLTTFSDFSLSVVPEPSSMALLGLAGFALTLRRRRK